MGVDNKQRRAAKRRARARQRGATAGAAGRSEPGDEFFSRAYDEQADAYGLVELQVTNAVRRIARARPSETDLAQQTEVLLRLVRPQPVHVVATVLGDVLAGVVDDVVGGGWGPDDLGQLVRRNASPTHLPVLAAVLHEERRRNGRSSTTWQAAVEALGAEQRLRLDTPTTIGSGLQLAALLAHAPLVAGDQLFGDRLSGDQASGPPVEEHPKLARVRALLAKAESTEFDEEAQALTAKAQELISTYALGRLLDQRQASASTNAPQLRRVWLDAPYVGAKASLVSVVAGANRCRSAVAEKHGFCVLVGSAGDLDAVELLVTSLLVQASTAMLRQGRRHDRSGTPRTRSFRQSFLMAYAAGIGDRLRTASEVASRAAAAAEPGRFLPVLRDHEERVAEAFEAMVPHTTGRARQIGNGEGWAAGLAAAELAQLDVEAKIADRAG